MATTGGVPETSAREEFAEIFSTELLSISGGILAGVLLAVGVDKVLSVPGSLILFPGFLEMRNAISGSLFARINSALNLGELKPSWRWGHDPFLVQNFFATFVLVLIVSAGLGLLAYAASALIFGNPSFVVFWVAIVGGLLSNIIEVPFTIAQTFLLRLAGYDPANVMGPFITTTGDIFSVLSLLIAIFLLV